MSVRLRTAAVALAAVSLSGCILLGYPLPHYETVVAKADLTAPSPDPALLSKLGPEKVRHGQYLVEITGCAGCHTAGALTGEPDPAFALAGSDIGVAYTSPFDKNFPGVAYPSNLTPDPDNGLGRWSDAQIAAAIRGGSTAVPGHLAAMPWPLYQRLSDADVESIVAYLRSIPAIAHHVPARVAPGTRATSPYVYFGVYRSGPEINSGHGGG